MEFYKEVVSPILGHLDSKTWHTRARQALHLAETVPGGLKLLDKFNFGGSRFVDPRLHVTLGLNCDPKFQVHLPNRTIVGAGWDKVGVTARAWETLGAGGITVGAVLPREQPEQDREPKLWYFQDVGVAFNRLGSNSPGKEKVRMNLTRYQGLSVCIGANIGINRDTIPIDAPTDYAEVVAELWPYVNWFEINVSSPNTEGLRALQNPTYLKYIIQAVNSAQDAQGGRKPVFVKISPDLSKPEMYRIVRLVHDEKISGVVACNTTIKDDIKARYGLFNEQGGISGHDWTYTEMVNRTIATIRQEAAGIPNFEIIGMGGVYDTYRATHKHEVGADVIGLVTGIREIGPTIFGRINRGVANFLDAEGINSAQQFQTDIIGRSSAKYRLGSDG